MTLVFSILLILIGAIPAMAQLSTTTPPSSEQPVTIDVWPGLAPGETTSNPGTFLPHAPGQVIRLTDVTGPQLEVFRPDDQPNHPAVLVFPGGGYSILAVVLEGQDIAEWLNKLGFVAIVLTYRVPNNREGAFQDAQRAMSLVRARSAEFGVDPEHVGVIGFSAGGHLAARLSAGYDTRSYTAVDTVDSISCRPDFTLLIYPAFLTDKSKLGLDPVVQPHAGMPPVFMAQTRLDQYFDILPYASALQAFSVPFQALAYDGGGHGYGIHAPASWPVSNWPTEAATWLKIQTETADTK